jgi:hypothetical protein
VRKFSDQPDQLRQSVCNAVYDAGGMIAGYYGGAVQVALPADPDACRKLADSLRALGMRGENSITWFPLGSDNPPDSLRHYGAGTVACPRGDRPGYWKYRNYFVA